jgi:hypothetical protein
VVRGVSEKDTKSGSGSQLVGSSGCGVRVTRTPEDLKVVIPRRGTEKSVVWRQSRASSGRKTIEKIGGGVQALGPEVGGKRGLKKKGTHDVIGSANHALRLAVLRGGIRTRHAQLDTAREKESPRGGVIELTAIVTLDGLDGEAELSGNPGEKMVKRRECLRLGT